LKKYGLKPGVGDDGTYMQRNQFQDRPMLNQSLLPYLKREEATLKFILSKTIFKRANPVTEQALTRKVNFFLSLRLLSHLKLKP